MSRIDEALKRVAVGDAGEADLEPRAHSVRTAESSLDRYPQEDHQAEFRQVKGPRRPDLSLARASASPRLDARGQLSPTNISMEGKLVVSDQTSHLAVEQYRRLAAALHGLQSERGLKTLMVTSSLPEEGKTLTIANLALTLSESYRLRVLMIDADLRRPSLHEVFGLPNLTGLSEALRAESGHFPVLEVSPHLSVVPAGHPDANPMAKLTSARMRALLDEAAASFDWVLLDAPPVGLMPDANLLVRLTNAVLFVIAAGSTPYALVDRAIGDLGREFIVGTVLNRVEERSLPSAGYYGGYYGATTSS